MAEKILNTRIQLKIDTYANWSLSNSTTQADKTNGDFVLKYGEIGLCEIKGTDPIQTVNPNELSKTQILFKVGDGVTPFKNLQWASATAADVYAWAKQTALFTNEESLNSTSGDKTYTGNAITSVSWDSTLNSGKGGLKFVKGTQFATKAELDAALDAFGGDIASITDNDTRYAFEIPASGDNAGKLAITETKYINGKAEGNGTTTYYDFVTPDELTNILAGYVKSVDKVANTAITVTNTDAQNPKIGLVLDNSSPDVGYNQVLLSQSDKGLKAQINLPDIGIHASNDIYSAGGSLESAEGVSISVNGVDLAVFASDRISIEAQDTSDSLAAPTSITIGAQFTEVEEGNGTTVTIDGNKYTVNHADTSSVANVDAKDRTYVKSLIFDDYGHVTAVTTGAETVTNTEYHVEYDSTNKKIKLVAGADASKMEIPTDDFIKDGMINTVTIDEETQELVITWNTDAGKDATRIKLSELADIYTGVDGTTIKVEVSSDDKISAEVKTGSLTDGHIATNAAIAKTKLASDVQASLAKADTALQSHQDISGKKDVQTAIADQNLSGAKVVKGIAQDKQGVITVSTRDLTPADIGAQAAGNYKTTQTMVDNKITEAAHVLSSLTQNANGEISYEVKELTPGDIGAQVAGDYETAGTAQTLIDSLDSSVAATAESANQVSVLTGVIQTDGKLTEKTEVKLAAIAKTGNVNDLIQTSGDVLVFNCGSSTVNV